MKVSSERLRCCAWVLPILGSLASSYAQTYAVDWHAISGGGGVSTNAVYQVTGEVAGPDSGAVLTDGYYTVDQGFWSVVAAITVPGAPALHLTRTGSVALLSWPVPSTGFALQTSASVAAPSWTYLTNIPAQSGSEWQVSVTPVGTRFYRLARRSPSDTISLLATGATITAPFVLANGYIYQSVETSAASGGRAAFNFNLPNAGAYFINGSVSAPDTGANSFFANIDAEPQDPYMSWDLAVTTGFQLEPVSWRGEGGLTKVFHLTAGSHQIVIRGREANTLLQSLTVTPYP